MTRATVAEARAEIEEQVARKGFSHHDRCAALGPLCHDFCPPGHSGPWRDWHRGHGCRLDLDRTRVPCDCGVAAALDALVAAVRAEERERVEPLRRFAKQMLDGARQVDFVADGGSTQGLGERLGLIVATYHETACEDGCICAADYGSDEFPLTCYKDGPLLAAPTTEEPGR